MARPAPLLLALETATRAVSVALLRGEALIDEEEAPAGRPAAEGLLPALDALLRRAGVEVGAVEAFAVSAGPGSFTGLRIGIATLKGLAFEGRHPVAAVPTLKALARVASDAGRPVAALLDARRGELYAAAWEPGDAEPRNLLPEGLYAPEELARRLPAGCVLVGEGAALCGEWLRQRLGADVRLLPPPEGRPRARHVGVLGARILRTGEAVGAADLVPRYLRRAEAEVKRTGLALESGAQAGRDGGSGGQTL